jgi:hypothetical protein
MRVATIAVVAAALVAARAALPSAGAGPGDGLVTVEGELRPAAALFGPLPDGKPWAPVEAGEPGGVWADGRFVLLLVDGRVLARLGAALPDPAAPVRVRGIVHDNGRAVTPVRIEYRSAGGWVVFDLPRSGTLAPAVLEGDE